MTQTDIVTEAAVTTTPSLSSALALFGLSLVALLGLSQAFVLPRFTRIPVAGSLLTVDELQAREAALVAAINDAEDERRALMLPTRDQTFQALQEMKQAMPSPLALQVRLDQLAAAAGGSERALTIDHFAYVGSGVQVVIGGDVGNVGTSSMTVLATFVDSLRAEPFVAELIVPPFVRLESPAGFHSPFSITITLAPNQP